MNYTFGQLNKRLLPGRAPDGQKFRRIILSDIKPARFDETGIIVSGYDGTTIRYAKFTPLYLVSLMDDTRTGFLLASDTIWYLSSQEACK